jgi:hypothetical protein
VATKQFSRYKEQVKAGRPREWGAYYRDWMVQSLIHELAHFVGPDEHDSRAILDIAARHTQPDQFAALTRQQAIRNADTYARFCNACTPGTYIPFAYYPNWR